MDKKLKKVDVNEIAYFFAMEKNVFLVTFENNTYPINYTLDKLSEIINPDAYFRINRKLIVNINSIKKMIPYSRSRIKLILEPDTKKDIEFLVSVERSSDFKKWMDK